MSSTIDEIRANVEKRLAELTQFLAEHEQLTNLRAHLDTLTAGRTTSRRTSNGSNTPSARSRTTRGRTRRTKASKPTTSSRSTASGSQHASSGKSTGSSSSRSSARTATAPKASTRTASRAPRGANREKVLTVLGAASGELTVAELSTATGIARGTLYQELSRAAKAGSVQKREANGRVTYSAPSGASS